MRTGWAEYNGDYYYFGEDGKAFKDVQTVSGRSYKFNNTTGKVEGFQIVNGKKYDVDDLVKSMDYKANMLNGNGDYMLTGNEISILSRNGIDYQKYSSYKDLIFELNNILYDEDLANEDADELEWVLENISERDYYQCSNK